ncbi:MAG TPA: hypothetical protein VLE74_04315 [Candidatus Saccharimonadales bacterium]|nr:hypothetical protein [Candidatus Saccharimonadales bacterium]
MTNSEISNPADIDPQVKRDFFVKLALGNRALFKLHQDAGHIRRYKPVEGSPRLERWGDPTQHCLVEAAASQVLADLLNLSDTDRQDLVAAAFIHDAGKRKEIEALQAAKAANPDITPEEIDVVDKIAGEQSKKNLLDAGIGQRVVDLTSAVAHGSLDQFAYLNGRNEMRLRPDVPTVTMAMHYIDDVTNKTNIVRFDERIDGLEAIAEERYLYNPKGRAIWGGRTYFEAQREVGHLIEGRLAEIAGISDPQTLPDVINAGLVDLIVKS